MEQLQKFLHNGFVTIRSSRLVRELKTFAVINRKPQAQKGKHDDLVLALALLLGVMIFVHRALLLKAAESYSFTTIDVPGSRLTVASNVDILGRVVGYYIDDSGTHGFLSSNGSISRIPLLT